MRLIHSRRLMLFSGLCLWVLSGCSNPKAESVPPHDSFVIESGVMNEARRINVYLPPEYTAEKSDRYSVIYMPDGGVHEDFPHIATTIDTAIRDQSMQPLILVGIENTERRRDMTGPTSIDTDRDIAPMVGGSEAFRSFIATELIPRINSRYRVSEESGIIGESAAGLFIVETFFLQPDLFDVYIALSPSLWWNDEELVKRAGVRLQANPDLDCALYLTSANETDIAPQVARLADVLKSDAPAGLRWKHEPRPDLRHDNIYRTLSLPVMLQYFGAE